MGISKRQKALEVPFCRSLHLRERCPARRLQMVLKREAQVYRGSWRFHSFSDRLVGRRQNGIPALMRTTPRLGGAYLTLSHAVMATADTSELALHSVCCSEHFLLEGGQQPRAVDIGIMIRFLSSSEYDGMLIFCAPALLQHPRDGPTPYVVHPRVRAVAGANATFQSKQPELCRREARGRFPISRCRSRLTSAHE